MLLIRPILVLSLALAGCSGSSDKSSASSADEAARRFAAAVTAHDRDAAARLLMPAEACSDLPQAEAERCKASAAALRQQLPTMLESFPEGAKLARVEESEGERMDPSMSEWSIYLEGDERPAGGFFVVEMDGTYYAAFAMAKPKPSSK